MTWTQGSAPNLNWRAVASSGDGTKMVAVTYGGFNTDTNGGIYASSDAGRTWQKTAAPTWDHFNPAIPEWTCVASSADGTRLVAGAGGAYGPHIISISRDSGATWTTDPNLPNGSAVQWCSVASSSDGTKLVAVWPSGIYSSTNSGTNWTQTSGPNSISVASSADAANLTAVSTAGNPSYGNGIYTSTNAGATWIH